MSETAPIIELPDIIQSLQNKRWLGTLEVVSGTSRRCFLFFREGLVQHRKMDHSQVILGRALYELGLIDEADYVMTLVDHERTGRRLGEVLVELGLVDRDSIQKALHFQAREDIFDLFTWKNLDVRFHPGDPPLPAVFAPEDTELRLNISGMSILMEAARRADEWELVRSVIPSEHDVLAPPPGGLPEGLVDRRVALLIDGYRSAYEIAKQSPLNTIEALRALADLVKAGHLTILEPAELAKVGVEAERDEDYEKALHVYELAADRGLEHLDLYRRIALAYHRLGRNKEALDRWIAVADRCVRLDRRDLAITALRDALQLAPEDLELRRRLARLLIECGLERDAAIEYRTLVATAEGLGQKADALVPLLQDLLELAPSDKPALERLAQLHIEQDDTIQAMGRLDDLASVLLGEDRPDEAVAIYYRILDLDAENLDAHLRLAQTLAKMGSTDDAVREYRRLADTLYRSGLIANSINWSFLIQVYESIVELEPSSTPAWEWLAKAYVENGQLDLAVSRYEGMAQSLEPAQGEAPPHEMLQPLRRIVELDPDRLDVRRRLAETHLGLNQTDRAVRTLRELAERALAHGRLPDAREAYEDALAVAPFDMDSRRGLAAMAERAGNVDEAQLGWKLIGAMCLRAGLYEDAARDLRRAVQLRQDDVEALYDLARAEDQRSAFRSAAAIYARYAELMLAQGNQGLAREALERARALEPSHSQANQLLARLGT
ncbi:MAG: tetratricopeptide repeat protein [Planctomycetes bacterium]|nr:tetratricopeptide repeat protein [Planctomycetota bacterium]